jgi:hypothetical protein
MASKIYSINELRDRKENDFCLSLIEMDSRIKVYNMFGYEEWNSTTAKYVVVAGRDLVGTKMSNPKYGGDLGYIPEKERLLIPTDLPLLQHEIAHIVEMTNFDRLLLNDLGMPLNGVMKKFQTNSKYTFAALSRETRVEAIQSIIMDEPDFRFQKYITNPVWDPKKHLPFGRFKTVEDIGEWVQDIHEKTRKAWTKERVRYEWIERLNFIRNWMETN